MQLNKIQDYKYTTKSKNPTTLICELYYEPAEAKVIEQGSGVVLEPSYPEVVYLIKALHNGEDIAYLLDERIMRNIEQEVLLDLHGS